MFKAFLKIIPQLESNVLNTMEKTLNSRFAKVAKTFAGGLKNAILGGGIAALGLGIIDKLINPLKAVNENIDKIFGRAENLTEQANQFGTTTGTLLKLQTIGKASGVDPEELSHLLVKFQGALVQARANPGAPSAVGQFVNEKDTADAFFKFLQGLKAAGKLNRELAEEEVFGERKVLSIAKFLSDDLEQKLNATAGINTTKATANIANAEKVGALDRTKQAIIDAKSFQKQSGMLTEDISNARARETQRRVDLETRQLGSFHSLENISAAADQIQNGLQKGLVALSDLIAKVGDLSKIISSIGDKITNSRLFKFMGKKLGLGD